MPSASDRVLLFIPMYNCERQIPRVVAQLRPEFGSLLSEVIIVDNRSTDRSADAAMEALRGAPHLRSKVLLNQANYGLGGSHKVAFNYALANGFDYCIVLHGDDQGDFGNLAPLIRDGKHREVDCLLGARFMPGSSLRGYSMLRTLGNRIFNKLYSLASRTKIFDLGSGLNMYATKPLAKRAYLRHADDLTFNYHMILHCISAGWKMSFFPITWREDDQVSNVKLMRQSFRVLAIVRDYAFRSDRYLQQNFSTQPGTEYAASVIFDSHASEDASR